MYVCMHACMNVCNKEILDIWKSRAPETMQFHYNDRILFWSIPTHACLHTYIYVYLHIYTKNYLHTHAHSYINRITL